MGQSGQRTVEAVLLYARATDATLPEFIVALNDTLRPPERHHFTVSTGMTLDLAMATDGTRSLSVALTNRPLAGERLAEALTARYASLRAHDYDEAAARHRATVTLSATSPAGLADAVLVLHHGIAAMMALETPEAVLWLQTGTIFVPAEIPPLDGLGFPVSLVTRPDFRTATPDARGRRRISLVSRHSEEWFGKPIVVEPTALPLPEVLSVIDLFILRKIAGEDLLEGDRRFAFPGGIEVSVRHRAPAGLFRHGHIELVLRPTREGPQDIRPPATQPYGFKSVRSASPTLAQPGGPKSPRLRDGT